MLTMSPMDERELAFLSQRGQGAILELLQSPECDPHDHLDALRAIGELITRLERVVAASPAVSAESVPDTSVRQLLEETIFQKHEEPSFPQVDIGMLQSVRTTINELLQHGAHPGRDELLKCLHFIRNVVARRVRTQGFPVPQL